ncbi:putative GTP-binding protein YjiA [Planctomycetes bacterium Pla163]|uniref:Putative GTP-binding protein YjiA n=1 Tax=Rohdeia mirabilis TaxID=2528008 RepID=A0A518D0F0_9BACT|nr:putative GTP-binding protein YjiA [Planctomycetes bacterium Pla163]
MNAAASTPPDAPDERVPVTLLSGFLGSGKTTLLNRLLRSPVGAGIAVVVNEFGELPIDGRLVESSQDEVLELANGCICCSVRGDLVRTAHELFERRSRRLVGRLRFDRLVIEASGLASPGPVHQTFRLDDQLARQTRPAGTVTLCHAGLIESQMAEFTEAAEQVGYADVCVLNHTDGLSSSALDAAEASVRRVNALAPIHRAVRADVDVLALLDEAEPTEERWQLFDASGTATSHTDSVVSYSLVHDGALDIHRLKIWLQFVAARRDWRIMRMKGIVRTATRTEPTVVQAVHQYLEIGPGAGAAPERSILVVIGRDIDEDVLRDGWSRLLAGSS